jgi:hypothetical protein
LRRRGRGDGAALWPGRGPIKAPFISPPERKGKLSQASPSSSFPSVFLYSQSFPIVSPGRNGFRPSQPDFTQLTHLVLLGPRTSCGRERSLSGSCHLLPPVKPLNREPLRTLWRCQIDSGFRWWQQARQGRKPTSFTCVKCVIPAPWSPGFVLLQKTTPSTGWSGQPPGEAQPSERRESPASRARSHRRRSRSLR